MRRVAWLFATVGISVGLGFSQVGLAHGGIEKQPCVAKHEKQTWSSSGVSNEAHQCNGTLTQKATNEPIAVPININANGAVKKGAIDGYEYSYRDRSENEQSNRTWLDQSQHANALQLNVARQTIAGNPPPPPHDPPDGNSDGGGSGLSNDADQQNQKLKQTATNEPIAVPININLNGAKLPWVEGEGDGSENEQSNWTWVDQSQHANALQLNAAYQTIAGNPPPPPHDPPDGNSDGGGSGLSNEADQSNGKLTQTATNHPIAVPINVNVNASPQLVGWGDNYQSNEQSNRTWVDQSQEANAAQVNVARQSIGGGSPSKVDPSNDADQKNGTLTQTATNAPIAVPINVNANASPQASMYGGNYQYNEQSNSTAVDQSQQANAAQVNAAGQSIG